MATIHRAAVLAALTCLACGAPDQETFVSAAQSVNIDSNALYRIVGIHSGKCAQVAGNSTSNFAQIEIATCNSEKRQQFRFEPMSGYYRIHNVNSDLCLDVEYASTANGAHIIQYSCHTGYNQQWSITDAGTDRQRLTPRQSGKALDVSGWGTADGTSLQQWSWANQANQQFRLEVVNGTDGGTDGTSGEACETISGSTGWTSRYWDCCKPHCGWSDNSNPTLKSCSSNGTSTVSTGSGSACSGGNAYMCYDFTPWAVTSKVAYGYAATPTGSNSCGKCYELQFTGAGQHSADDPGSMALKGKTMIVQSINVGGDVGQGQFDLMIPGGGVGLFDACSAQWGVSSAELGQQYGGLLTTCRQQVGYGAPLSSTQDCLRNKCNSLFTDAKGLGTLREGCLFYADWMMAADNPKMTYKEVKCPDDLVNKTALTQGGSSTNTCGG